MLVRYYKIYLWVYLSLFVALFLIAISWDTFDSVKSSSPQYPKVLSVFTACVFSSASIFLFHKTVSAKLKIKLHKENKNLWSDSFLKSSKLNKKARFDKKFMIFGANFLVNLINVFPFFLFGLLYASNIIRWDSKIFSLLFLSIAILLRYISWYITFFGFLVFLFLNRGKKLSYLS